MWRQSAGPYAKGDFTFVVTLSLLALRGWPSGFVCLVGGLGGRELKEWLVALGRGWLVGGNILKKKGFLCVCG